MLYHVSSHQGLKTIVPHTSSHGKPYVYAVENVVTGLLFGTKQDDFDFMISTDNAGNPSICECYPNAFEKVYKGKSCSVYALSGEGFVRGKTSWDGELVSENEVKVISETVIPDLYDELLRCEENGSLNINRYSHSDEYKKMISSHVVDRIIKFNINLDDIRNYDTRFSEYYSGIVDALKSISDGHLLKDGQQNGGKSITKYGSIYLVVKDFVKSLDFYEKILDMKVSAVSGQRFAMFCGSGLNLCLMNGYFDSENADKVAKEGEYFAEYDDMCAIAESKNSKKVFINLGVDDLKAEYGRIKSLGIAENMTSIRYVNFSSPYWYFTFSDPDGNPIEVTGGYEQDESKEAEER